MSILSRYTKSNKVSLESTEEEKNVTVDEALEIDDSDTPEEGGTPLENLRRRAEARRRAEEEKDDENADDATEETPEDEETGEKSTEEDETDTEETDDKSDDEDKEDEESDEGGDDEEVTEEDKEEAAVELESLLDRVQIAMGKGGLSEENGEATVVTASVKHILSKVGMSGVRLVPSVESFSESMSRRARATSIVIDNIQAFIKELRGK